jgi:hypothetical protein
MTGQDTGETRNTISGGNFSGPVRQVRLEQAHRELQDGDSAAGVTVAATGRRWVGLALGASHPPTAGSTGWLLA